jgi:hypothetical protein
MPGTQNNANPLVQSTLDLDALLASRVLSPKPVKLAGKTYMVRTDLTGAETAKYFKLANDKKDVEAIALLLVDGQGAKEINALLDKLPREHMNIVLRELMLAAQVAVGTSEADSGESKAS